MCLLGPVRAQAQKKRKTEILEMPGTSKGIKKNNNILKRNKLKSFLLLYLWATGGNGMQIRKSGDQQDLRQKTLESEPGASWLL